jgi:hypothetical protein
MKESGSLPINQPWITEHTKHTQDLALCGVRVDVKHRKEGQAHVQETQPCKQLGARKHCGIFPDL